jgi:hypothetical protein
MAEIEELYDVSYSPFLSFLSARLTRKQVVTMLFQQLVNKMCLQ